MEWKKAKVFVALSLDGQGIHAILKCGVTPNIKQASVRNFTLAAFAENSVIRTDGYRSYIPTLKKFSHEHKTYDPSSGLLHWLHIIVSNAKALISNTYHGLPKDNLQSYLDEFCFRSSRRSFGTALLDRLVPAIAISVRLSQRCNHNFAFLNLWLPPCYLAVRAF